MHPGGRMRNYLLIGFTGLLLAASPDVARTQETDRPIVRFGVVMDGPWAGNDGVRALFEQAITELLQSEFDPRFPPEIRRVADWTLDGVRSAVDELLTDPEVDFFLAMGPVSSHVTAVRPELEKPTLGAFVLDAQLQGLPQESGGSGVPNLSYVSIPLAVQRDIEVFRQVVPFDRLVFLANPHFMDAAPALADRLEEVADALGIVVTIVLAEPPADATLGAIPDDAEAVYVAPLLHFPQPEWDRLIAGLNGRRLPTFSSLGAAEVDRGILASLDTEDFFPRIARRSALNIQSMLLGEDGSELPVAFASGERLTINMATARTTGAFPSWTVLTEADLLNEEVEDVARTLSLGDAVREAVAVNLDLRVADRGVAAGEEDIRRARSVLRPQVDLLGSMVLIDEDRANAKSRQSAAAASGGGCRPHTGHLLRACAGQRLDPA